MTLAWLAVAWLLGIAAAGFTGGEHAAAVAAAGLFAAGSFALRPRLRTLLVIAVGVALIFAASWRYDSTVRSFSPTAISRFNGGPELRLRAIVNDAPEEQEASQLYRLEVREALVDGRWREQSGGLLMRTAPSTRYEYGDLIEVRGQLETPPQFEGFDYREYLSRRGIESIASYPEVTVLRHGNGYWLKSSLIEVRSRLSRSLLDVLPEPQGSLAGGILFGARSAIPRELKDDMNATGTSHLVAVSGQNVTILAALLIAGLAWLIGRRPAC